MVPRMGSFVYHELAAVPAGILFLTAQIALPLGAFLSGLASDFSGKFRSLLLVQTLGVSACLLVLTSPPLNATSILITFFLLHLASGGVNPLVSTGYLQSGLPGDKFAHARMYGTAGFMLVNLLLIALPLSHSGALQTAAFLFAISIIFVWFLPSARKEIILRVKPEKSAVWALITSRHFLLFLGLMIWYNFQFIAAETVLSEYLTGKKIFVGCYSMDALAVAWTSATFIETLFFLIAPKLMNYVSSLSLLALSFASGFLRYLLLIASNDPLAIALGQGLHGLHFAPAYLASVLYTREKAPAVLLATATALTQLFSRAIGGGVGGFLFGELAPTSIETVFLLNAAAAAAGWIFLILFRRTYGKQQSF